MKCIKQILLCTLIATFAVGALALGVKEVLEKCGPKTTAFGGCGALADPNRTIPAECTNQVCMLWVNPNGQCVTGGLVCWDPSPGQTVTVTVKPGLCKQIEFPCYCWPTIDPGTSFTDDAFCS